MMRSASRPTILSGSALLLALLVGPGCQEPVAAKPAARVYAIDLAGKAKTCTVPTVRADAAKPTAAAMTLSNDGGWCGIGLRQESGRPFAAGLVQTRAQHGMVHVHTVGDDTRVGYTPDAGFAGQDTFAVRLLPGNAVLNVAVTVTPR